MFSLVPVTVIVRIFGFLILVFRGLALNRDLALCTELVPKQIEPVLTGTTNYRIESIVQICIYSDTFYGGFRDPASMLYSERQGSSCVEKWNYSGALNRSRPQIILTLVHSKLHFSTQELLSRPE